MPYDINSSIQEQIDENRRKMRQIENEIPNTYFFDKHWKRLNESNRQMQHEISVYNDKVNAGAKF